MDKKGQWRLSPAFDMTYSFDPKGVWTKVHQIKLNGKQEEFTLEDIMQFGKYCNLTHIQVSKIVDKTIEAFKEFEKLANKYNVPQRLKHTILENLRIDIK